ncbi:MAG: hypothetical protein CMK07_11620 [Ponticaulis sp.]|nr:hypothetical protein [Ponticaulis sp.]
MKRFYLLMTVIGGLVPWVFFIIWFAQNGVSPSKFIGAIFVNPAAAAFTIDLVIASLVFLVWSFLQSQEKSIPGWPFVLIANLTAGLSMALPLFLYFRETIRSTETKTTSERF